MLDSIIVDGKPVFADPSGSGFTVKIKTNTHETFRLKGGESLSAFEKSVRKKVVALQVTTAMLLS